MPNARLLSILEQVTLLQVKVVSVQKYYTGTYGKTYEIKSVFRNVWFKTRAERELRQDVACSNTVVQVEGLFHCWDVIAHLRVCVFTRKQLRLQ